MSVFGYRMPSERRVLELILDKLPLKILPFLHLSILAFLAQVEDSLGCLFAQGPPDQLCNIKLPCRLKVIDRRSQKGGVNTAHHFLSKVVDVPECQG